MDASFQYTVQNPTIAQSERSLRRLSEQFWNRELDEVYIIYTQMRMQLR